MLSKPQYFLIYRYLYIFMAKKYTTIQVTKELKEAINAYKKSDSDSYEDLIWDLLEDRMLLSEETIEAIVKARNEPKKNFVSWEKVKSDLKLK
jgi:hypothetical protein